jgi:hypothetical protein
MKRSTQPIESGTLDIASHALHLHDFFALGDAERDSADDVHTLVVRCTGDGDVCVAHRLEVTADELLERIRFHLCEPFPKALAHGGALRLNEIPELSRFVRSDRGRLGGAGRLQPGEPRIRDLIALPDARDVGAFEQIAKTIVEECSRCRFGANASDLPEMLEPGREECDAARGTSLGEVGKEPKQCFAFIDLANR